MDGIVELLRELADEMERLQKVAAAPQEQQAIPEGWRLVPVAPTMGMVRRGVDYHGCDNWYAKSIWASMISAAPQPPAPKSEGVE